MISGKLGKVNEALQNEARQRLVEKLRFRARVWSNFGTRLEVNLSKHVKNLSLIDMLALVRNLWGTIATDKVKWNSRPVRRIELYTKICTECEQTLPCSQVGNESRQCVQFIKAVSAGKKVMSSIFEQFKAWNRSCNYLSDTAFIGK